METFQVIAIDGPAASGKSSVARCIAPRIGYSYVNSGNLYRAVTWLSLQMGTGFLTSTPSLINALESGELAGNLENKIFQIRRNAQLLDTELIAEEVNQHVSSIASLPEVRAWTLKTLRSLASLDSLVMEGRDIGSVVFPSTPYKFYVDARPEVREQRRRAQGIEDEIAKRDQKDSTRKTAPLRIAENATLIDNSDLTIEGTIEAILDVLKKQHLLP